MREKQSEGACATKRPTSRPIHRPTFLPSHRTPLHTRIDRGTHRHCAALPLRRPMQLPRPRIAPGPAARAAPSLQQRLQGRRQGRHSAVSSPVSTLGPPWPCARLENRPYPRRLAAWGYAGGGVCARLLPGERSLGLHHAAAPRWRSQNPVVRFRWIRNGIDACHAVAAWPARSGDRKAQFRLQPPQQLHARKRTRLWESALEDIGFRQAPPPEGSDLRSPPPRTWQSRSSEAKLSRLAYVGRATKTPSNAQASVQRMVVVSRLKAAKSGSDQSAKVRASCYSSSRAAQPRCPPLLVWRISTPHTSGEWPSAIGDLQRPKGHWCSKIDRLFRASGARYYRV